MTQEPASPPERPRHDGLWPTRKTRDASLILPLAGMVALMPPAGQILAIDGTVFGVPVVVAYVFAVWALLILLARRLALRFSTPSEGREAER
ncbi:MAG: hypothetical protein AAFU49_13920 [Pseudomonadota bacterium]